MSNSERKQFKRGDAVWVSLGTVEFPGFVKTRDCLGYDVFIQYQDKNNRDRTLDIRDVSIAELRERVA